MNHNNKNNSNSSSGCYFHRREIVIGICALCLNERLLILASKQASSTATTTTTTTRRDRRNNKSSSSAEGNSFSKFFAFGSYFFNSGNRLEVINFKSNDDSDYDDCVSTSQDGDSFISIKFEDNGDTSWDKVKKTTASKVSLEQCKVTTWNHSLRKETPKWGAVEPLKESSTKESKSVIEHAKPRETLRWRKRIGQLFQLVKWKRSIKTNVSHVSNNVDGVTVRKSWIRTLIKKTT